MNAPHHPVRKPEGIGIPLRFAAVLLGLGLLLPGIAAAVVTNSRCVGNLQAPLSPGNSCTANDVTFILVGLGDQTNGCVTTNDTATLFLGAQLQNTTGFTRYDIGMFIYNYLGNDDPTPDAFGGRQCAVETLKPVFGTAGVRTCPPLNLASPTGPYYNADGNTCGDLEKGQCNNAQIAMQFPDPLTIRCSDIIGANGSTQPDGFVDIPTCATWGNNAGQVGPGGVCTNETTVHPGTGSKCNCEVVNSNVPVARLATSCSCTPTAVRPGQSAACTVSLTNTIPNCTAAAGPAERFQCGTASFVRLKVGYNAAQGQILNSSGPPATPRDTTGGTVAVDTSNQQVVWTPRNTTLSGTSLGVVGPNQSGSMTYQFFVDPSVASGTTINQTATVYWANGAGFGSEEAQPLTATCSFQVSNAATWARVSSFAAREDDGRVVVEWETAAEVGTAAFEIERQDPESGRFVRVADRAVPAVEQLPGGRYRLADPAAPRGGTLTYRVIEIDQQGRREIFGPFEVAVEGEARRPGGHTSRDFSAEAKAVSPRLTEALKNRRHATAKARALQTAARLEVEVTRNGMVRVPAREIANGFGLALEEVAGQLRAGRLRLSRGGQDVAWQPAADGDGLVFYGEEIRTPSTDVNVYWLERAKGQTVATVTVQPASGPAASSFLETLHLETDAIPAVTAPLPLDDFWIWKSFFPGFPGFDRATFAVDVPAPAVGPATLAVHLHGFAAAQRAGLRVNGQDVAEISWTGAGPHTGTATLPSGTLLDGANQIEVVALEGALGFWLDSFDLTYPRTYRAVGDRLPVRVPAGGAVALTGFRSADIAVYDVAQPLSPRRLGGLAGQPQPDGTWGVSFLAPGAGPFLAVTGGGLQAATVRPSNPADLSNPGRGAEYVVIAPAALRAEAQRLADLRAAQGLTAMVVDLDDVMDVYAHGVKDPLAIRRFLADAVRSWPTPPRYVALAGKGTYDDRNLLGLSSSLLPTLLVTVEEGLAPADSGFADFDGDGVPSVAIGRIPAVTPDDLRAYVDKIAAYESAPGGDWTSRALLVADDPDHGGDFPETSAALAGALAPGIGISRIDLPGTGPIDGSRALLQDALRQGYWLVNYVGHGGLDRLDSSGLLLTSDVPALGNGPRLPIMTALTCLIAQFAYPSFGSIGEELVLQPDGGVAALFGPTWLSQNAPASELGRHLLPTLSAPDGGRLGDRLLRGLAAYAEAGGDREMLRVYTLLGDPALVVRR
ncbi:MAG TPA: C25 family cysteine peptidase [Thermoanaerobaculia bacterium]|nr:C25 family cysteine peptidase [Thermoanaerobaculia bacterium]